MNAFQYNYIFLTMLNSNDVVNKSSNNKQYFKQKKPIYYNTNQIYYNKMRKSERYSKNSSCRGNGYRTS